jgi:hypothetical protein
MQTDIVVFLDPILWKRETENDNAVFQNEG